MSPDDLRRKLHQLLRLGLSPSANAHEAAIAVERAKEIALANGFDLTYLLDELPTAEADSHFAPDAAPAAPDWRTDLTAFLGVMTEIDSRAARLSQLLANLLEQANEQISLFSHSEWQSRFQEVLDAMSLVCDAIRASAPSEPLLELYLLYQKSGLMYLIRIIHATKALECLRRFDSDGAAVEFGHVASCANDLSQMAEYRVKILDPTDDYAALRSFFTEMALYRAQVAEAEV
jgi:hypothetical protein